MCHHLLSASLRDGETKHRRHKQIVVKRSLMRPEASTVAMRASTVERAAEALFFRFGKIAAAQQADRDFFGARRAHIRQDFRNATLFHA